MSQEQTADKVKTSAPLSGSERMEELALINKMIGRRPQGVYVAHLPRERTAVVIVHRNTTGTRSYIACVVDRPDWSDLVRREYYRLPVGVLSPRFAATAIRHSTLKLRASGKAVGL